MQAQVDGAAEAGSFPPAAACLLNFLPTTFLRSFERADALSLLSRTIVCTCSDSAIKALFLALRFTTYNEPKHSDQRAVLKARILLRTLKAFWVACTDCGICNSSTEDNTVFETISTFCFTLNPMLVL